MAYIVSVTVKVEAAQGKLELNQSNHSNSVSFVDNNMVAVWICDANQSAYEAQLQLARSHAPSNIAVPCL